jgi:hypothetical protein
MSHARADPSPQEDGTVIAPTTVVASRRSVESARAELPKAARLKEKATSESALITVEAEAELPLLAAPQAQPADLRGMATPESIISRDVAANLASGADILTARLR